MTNILKLVATFICVALNSSTTLAQLQVLMLKSRIKLRPTGIRNMLAAVPLALYSGASLHAQTQYDFTIEPSVNSYCEDTPPLGDGFGWNGTCGCDVVPVWKEFGRRVAISNNVLAVTATDTPENCPGVGSTVSIYEKNVSSEWIKTSEFPGRNVSMVKDMVLIDSTAYRKSNNEWQNLALVDNDEDQFKAIDGLPGTVVSVKPGRTVLRFSTRDVNSVEVTHNEIQALRGEIFTHAVISGDIAAAKNYNWINEVGRPPVGVVLFHRDSNGIWQRDVTIAADVDDPINHLFTLNNSVVWIPRIQDALLNTWTYTDANGWEQTSLFALQDLPRYRDTEGFSSDKYLLFYSAGWGERSRLRTLSHESGRNWVEHGRFEFDQPGAQLADTGHGIQSRNIAFDGEHILFGYKHENVVKGLTVSADGSFSQQFEGSCDYSTADQYDGYGWNSVTQESCPPLEITETETLVSITSGTTAGCDYTNAINGWGWNAAISQSCPPLENANNTQPTALCIDTDGDGYGWDGVMTCLVDSDNSIDTTVTGGDCDYSNADLYGGWGWNAATRQSCAPLENVSSTQPTTQCIDTDGDGYGWDGTSSCVP